MLCCVKNEKKKENQSDTQTSWQAKVEQTFILDVATFIVNVFVVKTNLETTFCYRWTYEVDNNVGKNVLTK